MNARTIAFVALMLVLPAMPAGRHGSPISSGFTQTKSPADQEPARIKVKTELMQIRAVVTERSGKAVDSLTEKDFVLSEDGIQQPIAFFSLDRVPAGPAVKREDDHKSVPEGGDKAKFPVQAASVSRSVVLLVDDLHTSLDSLAAVRTALHRFVEEELTDQDDVALKTTTGRLGVMEQFIQDRNILRRGIDRILPWRIHAQESLFTPSLAGRILRMDPVAVQLGLLIMTAEEGTEGVKEPAMPGITDPAPENRILSGKSRVILAEERYQRLVMVSTVAAVVDKMAELPGQRMIAFFSDGFTSVGASGETAITDLRPIISRAARSGVAFYTFNAKGLANPMITASMPGGAAVTTMNGDEHIAGQLMSAQNESELDLMHGMGVLAAETGGRFFNNTNDFAGRLKVMMDENLISYELAYYPPLNKDPGKIRSITVAVKDHPEYKVRAQKSYVLSDLRQAKPEFNPETAQGRLHQAMSQPLPVTDIRVSASAQTQTGMGQKKLEIWIKGEDLSFHNEGDRSFLDLEVETVIFDSQGKTLKSSREPLKTQVSTEQIGILREKNLQHVSRLELKPGIYHVRIGVRDAVSDRMGTAIVWLEIPKPGK